MLDLVDDRGTAKARDKAHRVVVGGLPYRAVILSYRKISQQLEIDDKTVKEHRLLLEQLFLIRRLPGWRPGLGAREAARPKAYVCDPGLLAHLLGADESRIRSDDQVKGKPCATFVLAELLKHAGWAEQTVRLFHYQRDREDVDFILENNAGEIAAIEVKASATVACGMPAPSATASGPSLFSGLWT